MSNYSICFNVLYNKFTTWTWQELLFGVKNNIITIGDVINYVNNIISESNSDFEDIMQILLADISEVEPILEDLSLKEKRQKENDIASKWIFVIIYYNYITNKDGIHDVIDNIYCEFGYPSEISCLVTYMPKEDGEPQDDKLKRYINECKDFWLVKS